MSDPPVARAPSSGAPEERAAFTDLYNANYGRVLAYARRRTDQESSARDVAADTFLVAWRRLEVALPGGLPWLYATAAMTLSNQQRSQRRQEATAAQLGRFAGLTASGPNSASDFCLAESDPATDYADKDFVRQAVRGLPTADRELLLLTVWEGLSVSQAAVVVGCSVAAAHVRLHRARKRLARILIGASQDVPGDKTSGLGSDTPTG